jgi:hypothetical protein
MAINKQIVLNIDGVRTNATSVILGNSTGSYGIKRNGDSDVVVAYGTAVSNPETGVYTYDVSQLPTNIEYTIVWKVIYSGNTQYITDTFIVEDEYSSNYTVNKIFTMACSLVDSLKTDGTVDTNTTSDYRARALTLIDMAQKDLLRVSDYYKIHEINHKPLTSLLGNLPGGSIDEYDASEDLTYEVSAGGAQAYFFECDGNSGTVYIEDYTSGWNALETITLSNATNSFMKYKSLVTPTSGATKSRIRFSGSYYYRVSNPCLYDVPFESIAKVPDFQPWIEILLPYDVKSIDKVVKEYPTANYSNDSFYKVEKFGNRQKLYISYDFEGKVRVQYKPIPTTPQSFTDVLLIDDVTARAICYYLAMNFVATEQNDTLTSLFKSQYESAKAEATIKQPLGSAEITNLYGTF